MHSRNRYLNGHDFSALARREPRLAAHLRPTPDGRITLDFTSPQAVYLLNRTLLLRDYNLQHWDLPAGKLVPPIPGRLDYIHALADLVPQAENILDIGTGASLIYPILGVREYGWRFVGTEIDDKSLRAARAIIKHNSFLRGKIDLRQQDWPGKIFDGVVRRDDYFDATICNPPFYASAATAAAASQKKWDKLGVKPAEERSFGGVDRELWTEGGEVGFLRRMLGESKNFAKRVGWFTTLVSQQGYLDDARQRLKAMRAEGRVIPLRQGNKASRILAWKF